jgi:hypothetical protein
MMESIPLATVPRGKGYARVGGLLFEVRATSAGRTCVSANDTVRPQSVLRSKHKPSKARWSRVPAAHANIDSRFQFQRGEADFFFYRRSDGFVNAAWISDLHVEHVCLERHWQFGILVRKKSLKTFCVPSRRGCSTRESVILVDCRSTSDRSRAVCVGIPGVFMNHDDSQFFVILLAVLRYSQL